MTSQHTNSKYDIASDAATTTSRPVGLRSQQEKGSPKVATAAAVGEPGETWGSRSLVTVACSCCINIVTAEVVFRH